MGSHVGGNAEGQKEYITEYTMVPILSSMEVVQIGELPDMITVYCGR